LQWQHLPQQRVRPILIGHFFNETAWHAQRKLLRRKAAYTPIKPIKTEHVEQLKRITDRLAERMAPIHILSRLGASGYHRRLAFYFQFCFCGLCMIAASTLSSTGFPKRYGQLLY